MIGSLFLLFYCFLVYLLGRWYTVETVPWTSYTMHYALHHVICTIYHAVSCHVSIVVYYETGVAPEIFRRGADSSDEGAKIWLLGYYKCQKSPKKSCFTFRRGASMLRRGDYSPLALPWRHPCYEIQLNTIGILPVE